MRLVSNRINPADNKATLADTARPKAGYQLDDHTDEQKATPALNSRVMANSA
jgi:hypothetical protein